jgi:hypothetical protein
MKRGRAGDVGAPARSPPDGTPGCSARPQDASAFAVLVPEAAAVLGPMPAEQVAIDMQRRRAFHCVPAFLRAL